VRPPGFTLVVTSIAGPTPAIRALAESAAAHDVDFVLIGDAGSPDFELAGCDLYTLERQRELDLRLAEICPIRHYTRKNIGYLLAMERGAALIVETDDDTIASSRFWAPRTRFRPVKTVEDGGWTNAYRYFSEAAIWPRGFPLDQARAPVPPYAELPTADADCPIQQGLVDDDPDVDAVYRLLFPLPFTFEQGAPVALGAGSWCPFNSQNTTWWRDAFPLLYLPATCSFRMTDIWRSFVAQRIAWANGWSVLFEAATVRQSRNEHDLNKDFADEVAGYLENRAMCAALGALDLAPGIERIAENMRLAYELLVERGWLDASELPLLDAWLTDVESVLPAAGAAVAS
jgi:hypothetical protein